MATWGWVQKRHVDVGEEENQEGEEGNQLILF